MRPTHTGTKITDTHRAQLAYVYIRQSTPGQLLHHRESTTRQYELVARAMALGWPAPRVQIIDDFTWFGGWVELPASYRDTTQGKPVAEP